jgi:DNA-binding transcriptional MerR regulator/quercetin dioxygenase-like cupin family protein
MIHARPIGAPAPPIGGYRIGEVARLVGTSASSLRLWERQGLVRPARAVNGYRRYSDEDVAQLRRVRAMRSQQVNAPGIRRLLPTPEVTGAPSPPGAHAPDARRLRRLRARLGLSLAEASRRSGLSVSYLSALERGAAGASIATLQRLTGAFGVTILDLFETARHDGRRLKPAERPVLELDGAGVRIEQLSVGSQALEPQLFVLAAGASSVDSYSHPGEEFVFVLDGEVTFWVGADERYRLRTGDSLTFPSTLPHRWRNRARGETRLLWINTPPTF